MSQITKGRAVGRGPSAAMPALPRFERRSTSRRKAGPALRPDPAPAVVRARQRLLEGFYDNEEILSTALDRLIDDVTARSRRSRAG